MTNRRQKSPEKRKEPSDKFVTEYWMRNALNFVLESAEKMIPTGSVMQLVSEWAEKNRILPASSGTPKPGPFSFEHTPYMREIADCLSDKSPIKEVSVMKGTQVGFSVGVLENWIGYTIGASPSWFLYVTALANMAAAQMETRIDDLINSSGIGDLIGSNNNRRFQRKTGDQKTRKDFPGGTLHAVGPNSGPALRSFSFKKIAVDELDAFPEHTGTEGNTQDLIRRRCDSFAATYKILWGSTPLLAGSSKIERMFLQGDQRRHYVPCIHCGHMQYLKWGDKDKPGGIRFFADDEDFLFDEWPLIKGEKMPIVSYVCEQCHGWWLNDHKRLFLPKGEWKATAKPQHPLFRSYHVPGLLSPIGGRSWEDGVRTFLEVKREGYPISRMQNWRNTFLGETYELVGNRPRIEHISSSNKTYNSGEVESPEEVLLITVGADVHGDHIKAEVVAWGENFESWSLNYFTFKAMSEGGIDNITDPAWDALRSAMYNNYGTDALVYGAVDSAYKTAAVYEFCDSIPERMVYPVRGVETISGGDPVRAAPRTIGCSVAVVQINTDFIKQRVYQYLNIRETDKASKKMGICHYPSDYDQKFFRQLTAESKIKTTDQFGNIKYRWHRGNKKNEPLDCRAYALGMVYHVRDGLSEYFRQQKKLEKTNSITWPEFWKHMKKMKMRMLTKRIKNDKK